MKHATTRHSTCSPIIAALLSTSIIFGLISCESKNSGTVEPVPTPFETSSFDKLAEPLSEELVYSRNVQLPRNAIIQCFDIVEDGSIYYLQIAGDSQHQLNLVKGAPDEHQPKEMMVFEYFGHGTNMALEETPEGVYVWLGSHGNKGSNGSYSSNQSISRIKYVPGQKVQPGAGDVFCIKGTRNIHPAVNAGKDLLGIEYSKKVSGVNARVFKVYRLSEAMQLTPEDMELSSLTYGGENGTTQKTEAPIIKARNLEKIKPIYEVTLSDGQGKKDQFGGIVGAYDFQGFDIDENFIYYYEGISNSNKFETPSVAFVSVVDKNGLLSFREEVKAISDNELLKSLSFADRGYMEAEGIKVKGDDLYIGFAARLMISASGDARLANIFKYSSN